MSSPRLAMFAAALIAALALPGDSASAQAPKINKPRLAPYARPNVLPLPPANYDKDLSIAGDQVKARKTSSRLSVEVLVNSRGPYRFVVDSGADSSVVGTKLARELELPLGTPALLHSTTAKHIVDRVKVDALTLGPTTVRDLMLPALSEYDVGGDGIIGIDALVSQRLVLDFDRKFIRVEDARIAPPKVGPDEIVITAKRSRGQLILTEVRTLGFPVDAVIDTGSEVTVGNLALREKLLKRRGEIWTVPATGVTGVTMNIEMAFIDELRIGPVTLQNVPIAFADLPPFALFGLNSRPALLLGTDLLETFSRVSLDFRARKVRFQLKKCGSDAVSIRTATTGLSRLSATAEQGSCGL